MAIRLWADNAEATLATGIDADDTSAVLATGKGALYPSPTGGDYFILTLTQAGAETSWEKVKVTARSTDTLTIERGAESSTPAAWDAGSKAELRWTRTWATDMPALNQSTTGSAATLTTPRAIYGNNFDGSAALAQVIASTYGGTGNGYTKFSGPTSTEKTFTLPDASVSVGYLDVPQNSKSEAYELVLGDAGKHVLHPSADTTARTFTIPANSSVEFAVGTAVTFVNQASAGVLTIAITTDTMRLAGAGTTGSRTLAANGIATALKITTTEWIISGTNLT